MRERRRAAYASGFTLVELAVTISIIAVLAMLAAPGFRELVASQRVQSASMDVYTDLIRTRSEALKQNADATMSSNSAGTDWSSGWKVANGTTDFEKHGPTSNITMTGSGSTVTYKTNGRLPPGAIPSFALSAPGTTTVRCVKVNLSGQPYVIKSTCS